MEATTQQKGKRAEFLVFGELIKRRADLYFPVIDTGIDAVIPRKDGTYLQIQVKSRTKQGGWFTAYDLHLYDDERFFIVCVDMSKSTPETWVIPSKIFTEYANVSKSKEGWNKYTLGIDSKDTKHGNELRRNLLKEYREAWKLLTG